MKGSTTPAHGCIESTMNFKTSKWKSNYSSTGFILSDLKSTQLHTSPRFRGASTSGHCVEVAGTAGLQCNQPTSDLTLLWGQFFLMVVIRPLYHCVTNPNPESFQVFWSLPSHPCWAVVFESLVRSGLLVPSALDHNCNWSSQFQKLPKTRPNRNRPVFCSLLRLQDWF